MAPRSTPGGTQLSADLIAARLSPFLPEQAAVKAGRLMLEEIREYSRQGGHNVPEEVIRRHFIAGHTNFYLLYRELVDSWALYDNAGDEPQLIDWSERP